MTTEWSKPTRYIVGASLVLLAILILYLSRAVIPLLIIAALIAVIVRPLTGWLHHKARLPRGLAVLLVYLLVVILVPLLLLLLIPLVVDAVQYVLSLDYQGILERGLVWLSVTLTSIKAAQLPISELDTMIDQTIDALLTQLASQAAVQAPSLPTASGILGSLSQALSTTFRTVAGVIGSVFSQLTLLLFIFLISIHISLNAHTFRDTLVQAAPARFQPEVATLIDRIVWVWGSFFRGELTLMLVIGLMSWLGLTILGVPGALYLGIIAGLLELIPNLGPIIATIPAVIVVLLQGSNYLPVSPLVMALIVIGFYILVQQMENNLIVPRVLGDAVDLPALVVMTGVFVGADTFGLLGALLATPVIASMRELIRYAYRKILGEEPFPAGEHGVKPAAPLPNLPALAKQWLAKVSRLRMPAPKAPGGKAMKKPKS